ncbi:hypothetical protein A1O1_02088 [Capronia coronata CBS 617.96]|uniref:Uncharacterized protein n=1 Tax=Capronia coronata CBS 617.96 TaxID=1182541 RepID=W9YWP0_9EURO|nr:uncharacterized protein A1O1_02088 [Capronia coronata CBS 617.96]EXJ93696.1 hypothetical protein A1O1_02088 [Capronia coronata CBS 617.96]
MAQGQVKDSDILVLIAAIQSSVGPIQVDAEKVARQLGMSLSSIPPKFTAIRKRYNIDIKVVNSGALQRNRPNNSPKKRQTTGTNGPRLIRSINPQAQQLDRPAIVPQTQVYPRCEMEQAGQGL